MTIRQEADFEMWCVHGCGPFRVGGFVIETAHGPEYIWDEDAECPECDGPATTDGEAGRAAQIEKESNEHDESLEDA